MTGSVRKAAVPILFVLALALVGWKLHTSHFEWAAFWAACRSVDWRLLLLATLILWTNFLFRAARWAVFLRPTLPPGHRVTTWQLVGPQFIGFAGLAALGRIGELIRPYLVSRRTGLSFPSQIAVVAVDRVFDLGAFLLLFAGDLLLSNQLKTLPFSDKFRLFGVAIAALWLLLALFLLLTTYAGDPFTRVLRGSLSHISAKAGATVADRVLQFKDGLNTVRSAGDFLLAALLSLLTWGSIALTYLVVCRAFPSPLHELTASYVILLLGFSVVGGLVQLPGVGGGAQVLTITALTVLFKIPKELATSAGILLWVITSMSVIVPGLLFARAEQVSLRSVARQSTATEPQPVY